MPHERLLAVTRASRGHEGLAKRRQRKLPFRPRSIVGAGLVKTALNVAFLTARQSPLLALRGQSNIAI